MQPGSTQFKLHWIPDAVANVLGRNGIHTRNKLATELRGVSRTAVYDTFDEGWSGEANNRVLAQMAGQFDVRLSDLVVEPAVVARRSAQKLPGNRKLAVAHGLPRTSRDESRSKG